MNHWFINHHGSRRGALLTYWHRLLFLFGRYRLYRHVNWNATSRLVFVCKGNICRSAYAEAVAKLHNVEAVSCGINTRDGVSANESAIKAAAAMDIDLQSHRTTRVQSLTINQGDLLIAMELSQAEYLKSKFKNNSCTILGLWCKPVTPHIQDPYGAPEAYFHRCFCCIENSVYEIAKKIKNAS